MEYVKNRVKEIWEDQSFVSSQMDGVESWLVALEKVAASSSHFIIEHWVPAQAILIDLHNSTCPSCQRVDGLANNGGLASEFVQSGWATLVPVPPPNSRQGKTPSIISPVPSLVSDSSAGSTPPFFFVGARQGLQERAGLSVYINKVTGSFSSFFGGDKGKLEMMKVFQKLQKDLGMGVALESFQKVLVAIEADMYHMMML